MTTYRERRERRAENYRTWAAKREQTAAAVFKADEHYTSDYAFNTQPGHIPERARLIKRHDRQHESLAKAHSMQSRADTIEDQLATSIYDDDPDAIERLTERIAKLEEKRYHAKTINAQYRKENRAELAALTPFGRSQRMPFPGYYFQNLSGNINRQKQRLARLERQAAS